MDAPRARPRPLRPRHRQEVSEAERVIDLEERLLAVVLANVDDLFRVLVPDLPDEGALEDRLLFVRVALLVGTVGDFAAYIDFTARPRTAPCTSWP